MYDTSNDSFNNQSILLNLVNTYKCFSSSNNDNIKDEKEDRHYLLDNLIL